MADDTIPISNLALVQKGDTNSPPPQANDTSFLQTWSKVIEAVRKATEAAFPSSPPFSASSPSEFQTYWYNVFTVLAETVAADSSIPDMLTSPPVQEFHITLFDEVPMGGCPCTLPETEPSIKLVRTGGVTKGDLVEGLRDWLYGNEKPGAVWSDSPGDGEGEDSDDDEDENAYVGDRVGRLVESASWYSGRRSEEGERMSGRQTQVIWVWCLSWEIYSAQKSVQKKDETDQDTLERKAEELDTDVQTREAGLGEEPRSRL